MCLIQKHNREDQPIAFASNSLTGVETRYANIEQELLAIIFAYQCFSTCLLGSSFIAESDHKPLEMIAVKNLVNVPPCLQRMLLELQRYNVTIKPNERLTGNQIGHASRLHCLHEAMDRETEGQHTERPHPRNSVSTHTARLATSTKTCATFSTEILGLQRLTINRRWTASERTEVNHTRRTSRGVSKPST